MRFWILLSLLGCGYSASFAASLQANEGLKSVWIESAATALVSFERVVEEYPSDSKREELSDFEAVVLDRLEKWLRFQFEKQERGRTNSITLDEWMRLQWKGLKASEIGVELQQVENGVSGILYFDPRVSKGESLAALQFFCHDHVHDGKASFDCHFKSIAKAELQRIKTETAEDDGHGSRDFVINSKIFIESLTKSLDDGDLIASHEKVIGVKIWKDRNDLRVAISTSKPNLWFSYCHFHKDGKPYCHPTSRRGSNEPLVVSESSERGKESQ